MDKFEIIKHAANRWEVRGKICNDSQRWRFEDYSRVFTNKKAAQADADKWEKLVAEAFEDHMSFQQWRLRNVKAYLASRADRPSASQLAMF